MLTIWKVELKPMEVQAIEVPDGAEFLCAREQHGKVCVWFRCDPAAAKTQRKIAVVRTGDPAPTDGRYLGTASLHDGHFILHVFAGPDAG